MAYNYPDVVQNEDGSFGPTSQNHYYKSVSYHNRTANHNASKSRWCLKQNEQYEVFRLADEGLWNDEEAQGLFSLVDGGKEILGQGGERIAFFPNPRNANDAWHGYPKGNPSVSDALIETWHAGDIISGIVYKRLLRHSL